MIKVWLSSNPETCIEGGLEVIPAETNDPDVISWIEIQSDDDQLLEKALRQLQCHPLAISDTLRLRHPPKIEYFEKQIYILYRGVKEAKGNLLFDHQQISFFISERCLITVSRGHSQGLALVKQGKSFSQLLQSPLNLACTAMHFSSGIYLDEVLQFDSVLGELEDELLSAGSDQTLVALTAYKSRILKLIRTFNYHQRITRELEKDDGTLMQIDANSFHIINDLNERFERLFSLSSMHYDICGDLIDGYLSITSHQLNNTMRVLTVVTAVFVPLSFLAGLYGMNFDVMPELHFKYGYYLLLGIMACTAISLVYFFKKKKWF